MKLGDRGERLIKKFEQCRLQAYAATEDERRRGIWTIGFGRTAGITEHDRITQEEADKLFREDVAQFEAAVNAIGVPLTQAMFDALVSLVYNVGPRAVRHHSLVGGALRAGNYLGAKVGFGAWKYQAGKVLKGLVRRREEEQALFMEDGLPKEDEG